jgi:hypothetical protein
VEFWRRPSRASKGTPHLMPGSRDQARELVDRYMEAAVAEAIAEAD